MCLLRRERLPDADSAAIFVNGRHYFVTSRHAVATASHDINASAKCFIFGTFFQLFRGTSRWMCWYTKAKIGGLDRSADV